MPDKFGLAANNCRESLGNRDFTRNPIHHRLAGRKSLYNRRTVRSVHFTGFRPISAISNPWNEWPACGPIRTADFQSAIFRIGRRSFAPA